LAQALGVEGRGRLAAVLQPLSVADSFAALGIPTALAYFAARQSPNRRLQKLAFAGTILTSAAAFAVLAGYSFIIGPAQGISPAVVAAIWLSVVPGALIAVRRAAWSGLQRWKLIDAERTTFALARLGIILVFAWLGLKSIVWFAAGPIAAGLLISAVFLSRPLPRGGAAAAGTGPSAGRFFGFSALAALGTVSAAASARLDQAIMPSVTSSYQLGLYAVAVTVAEIPLLVGTVLSRNLVPEVSAGAGPRQAIRRVASGFAVAAAGAAAIGILAGPVVPWLFGTGFSASLPALYVLLGSSCLTVLAVSCSAVLTGRNRPLAASVPQLVSIVVVIVLFALFGSGITSLQAACINLAAQLGAASAAAAALVHALRTEKYGTVKEESVESSGTPAGLV
jgi:O-antigen/teichoic acid export membrane protein